jgi:hypothetical protein
MVLCLAEPRLRILDDFPVLENTLEALQGKPSLVHPNDMWFIEELDASVPIQTIV